MEVKEQKKFVFLAHINRSGSTFLSKELDNYRRIGVSLEAKFIDGIINPMSDISSEKELEDWLNYAYNEPHFVGWKVTRDTYKSQLVKQGFPLNFHSLLEVALKLYFDDDFVDYYVFKNGLYIINPEKVKLEFPDAKIIYIVRDPRAIYASQKRSRNSEGKFMATNPFRLISQFKYRAKKIFSSNYDDYLLSVKYENLIDNKDFELSRILNFIGVMEFATKESDYEKRIPVSQKHLHLNIEKGPIESRKNAWQTELSFAEVFFIQKKLKREMRQLNYDLVKIKPSFHLYLSYLKLEYKYFVIKTFILYKKLFTNSNFHLSFK